MHPEHIAESERGVDAVSGTLTQKGWAVVVPHPRKEKKARMMPRDGRGGKSRTPALAKSPARGPARRLMDLSSLDKLPRRGPVSLRRGPVSFTLPRSPSLAPDEVVDEEEARAERARAVKAAPSGAADAINDLPDDDEDDDESDSGSSTDDDENEPAPRRRVSVDLTGDDDDHPVSVRRLPLRLPAECRASPAGALRRAHQRVRAAPAAGAGDHGVCGGSAPFSGGGSTHGCGVGCSGSACSRWPRSATTGRRPCCRSRGSWRC